MNTFKAVLCVTFALVLTLSDCSASKYRYGQRHRKPGCGVLFKKLVRALSKPEANLLLETVCQQICQPPVVSTLTTSSTTSTATPITTSETTTSTTPTPITTLETTTSTTPITTSETTTSTTPITTSETTTPTPITTSETTTSIPTTSSPCPLQAELDAANDLIEKFQYCSTLGSVNGCNSDPICQFSTNCVPL